MPVVAVYEKQGTGAGPTDDQFRQMAAMFGGTFRGATRGTGSGGQARTVAVFDGVTTTTPNLVTGFPPPTFGDSLWGAAQAVSGTAVDYHDSEPVIPAPWTV